MQRAAVTFLLALCAAVLATGALVEAPRGLALLVPALLFAGAAYLSHARLPSPRPWLLLAVLALLASFVPWAILFDVRWLLLNALLTALAAGSLWANVSGERRLRG